MMQLAARPPGPRRCPPGSRPGAMHPDLAGDRVDALGEGQHHLVRRVLDHAAHGRAACRPAPRARWPGGRSEQRGEQTEQRARPGSSTRGVGRAGAAGGGTVTGSIMPAVRAFVTVDGSPRRGRRSGPGPRRASSQTSPACTTARACTATRAGVTTPCRTSRALIAAKQNDQRQDDRREHTGVLRVAGGDQQAHRERDVECRHLPAGVRLVAHGAEQVRHREHELGDGEQAEGPAQGDTHPDRAAVHGARAGARPGSVPSARTAARIARSGPAPRPADPHRPGDPFGAPARQAWQVGAPGQVAPRRAAGAAPSGRASPSSGADRASRTSSHRMPG